MSPGEQMVWAAEFVRALSTDVHTTVAVRHAAMAVKVMRNPDNTTWLNRHDDPPGFDVECREMLIVMLQGRSD